MGQSLIQLGVALVSTLLLLSLVVVVFCDGDGATTRTHRDGSILTRKQLAHLRKQRHRTRLEEKASLKTVHYLSLEDDISPETKTLVEYQHPDLVHYDSDDRSKYRKSEGLTWLQNTTDRAVFGDPSVVVSVGRNNNDDSTDDNNDDTDDDNNGNATVHRERGSGTSAGSLVLYWTPYLNRSKDSHFDDR
eukprot:TRINITY_DN6039_c0_g1_i1.p1 TRINITY_DN6039_c0_g1~~TRINITY_DN6039_c0_g1_i1.p1  ORF type:complete len:190 (-),score=39.93 TRINITY_DN6039_c0_g1_i1:231-800(-)